MPAKTTPGPPRRACRAASGALAALLLAAAALPGGSASSAAAETDGAADSAVVFMYHRFGEDRYPSTSIRLEQFEAHLDYLAEHDYRVWPLARIVETLRRGEPLPERTVALTADDAYASVYEAAFPRLKARGWPMTVFVATDPVDAGRPGYMSWAQMREMRDSGLVDFANHSASHDYLVRREAGEEEVGSEAWEARMRRDVERAQRRLQAELGAAANTEPKLYAYPYGEYSARLAEILTDKGYYAFGQHSGAIGGVDDPRALPRFALNERYGGIDDFALRARSLPLPVAAATPFDPVIDGSNPPRLEVTLADGGAVATQRLSCFASGQGRITLEWLDEGRTRFAAAAPEPLGPGRSRYNCTAPHRSQDRYFWFSHLWVRGAEGGAEPAR
ncbi:polysaccharide deacetylase family protein [Halorhodospira neutriphila]|uniref:Polysaccharide deacetylase n=1 Tax=Halorhodospira neutriphila TaxID=168379 RepID=A0ABS1E5D4_9GAMM|nr:polysaccharide deacetylase family protein [Halorhodospira neutriphila]MBK1726728.1 hypothetical protein [Halorhodospira neutriphila]